MRNKTSLLGLAAAFFLSVSLTGCGYNDFQTKDESVKKAWAEVLNQYQRRSDLIPNLVATVQGFAQQEKDVLLGVTEARSRVGQMKIDESVLNNPQAMQNFQKAQSDLSGALSRLLVVSENYPQLKSDANFRDLQSQLEGTENRITVARKKYTESIEGYNILTRQFPTNLTAMLFGYSVKPQFTVENEKAISTAPKVDFGAKPVVPAPAPTPAPAPAPTK
ncbi:MAG: LemA family protein [Betaproteobacteria bacterium]|nr:LemA family protein [Betaproteobacteria bacterium]